MTPFITVRGFKDSDADRVLAIARDLQTHELTIDHRLKPVEAIDHSYIEALWKDIAKYRGAFLVAELDGVVAGYCTLLTHCDSAEDTDETFYTYSHLGDLAVSRETRSLGIGKALLAECESIARAAGSSWLRLGVLAGNRKAVSFYAREGFVDHLIKMEKPL